MELGRLPGMSDAALRVVSNLEHKWENKSPADQDEAAGGGGRGPTQASALAPPEAQEAERLMVDALLLKADLLSSAGRYDAAVTSLASPLLRSLTAHAPNAHVSLATKAFKYGQIVITKNSRSSDEEQREISTMAATCFKAALAFLEKDEGPSDCGESFNPKRPRTDGAVTAGGAQRSSQPDAGGVLRCKCLVMLALALQLSKRYEDALEALDQVKSIELRSEAQDIRLGVILGVRLSIDCFVVKFPFAHPSFCFRWGTTQRCTATLLN